MEIIDNKIYCEVDETITIQYLVPSNMKTVQIVECPYLLADYNVLTDTLTVYSNVSESSISVTDASYDLTYASIELEIDTAGTYNIALGYSDTLTQYEIHVLPTLTDLSMIFHDISDTEVLSRLQPGRAYTFEAELLVSGDETKFLDYMKNFRIGVCNAEVDTTSQSTLIESILENAEFSDQPEVNVKTRVTTEFTYDEDSPLIVLITADYVEGYPTEFIVDFSGLKIYESQENLIGMQCHHIFPIQNCITDDETSSITLDEFNSSNSFILSDFYNENDSSEDEDITYGNTSHEGVSGIKIMLDVVECGNVTLLATLRTEEGAIGQRSILLNPIEEGETPTTITIGDSDEMWGFDVDDFKNLEDWELILQLLNNTSEENTITFNNISLEYYTIEIEPNNFEYYINNNNLGYYGVFMQDIDIPTGLNTEIKQLEIEGSDTNVISRQNVREKTITLEFSMYNCDVTTTIKLLNKLARLIYNERDVKTNQPIPKVFSTSAEPGKEWEYVCIKEMETEWDGAEVTAKVELVVPDGTYKTVDEITTGAVGFNHGLNKIHPELTIGNISSNELTLFENNTGQKFIIRDLVYVRGDIITIDCENRTIIQSNPNSEDEIDISGNCDMDNDWFTINKEYNFISTNCSIMKITYFERG